MRPSRRCATVSDAFDAPCCAARAPVNNGINGDDAFAAVAPCEERWLIRVILRRWETTADGSGNRSRLTR
jgi:hypothetical protein